MPYRQRARTVRNFPTKSRNQHPMTSRLAERISATAELYRIRNGKPPMWMVAAPGRVNLIGEHVDYNDGIVLPMAIDYYTVIAAGPDEGSHATFYSALIDDEAVVSIESPERRRPGHWSNYVAGVLSLAVTENLKP